MPLVIVLAAACGVATALAALIGLTLPSSALASSSAIALGTTLTVLAVVGAAGLLLVRSRWSLPVLVGSAVGGVAATLWSGVGAPARTVVLTVGGLTLATGVLSLRVRWMRRRPSIDGPPPHAVVAMLGALSLPAIVAVVRPDGVSGPAWVAIALAVVAAAALSRGGALGLALYRLLLPVAAVFVIIAGPLPEAAVPAIVATGLGALGWHRAVARAANPVSPPPATGYRVPPELAPPDVLEAAGLDEKGRRR